MVKISYKMAICLLLGLGLASGGAFSNNLTQLDIKKSSVSPSSLNVTVYTSSPYSDNIAVTKKGENKYVILMPNVSGISDAKPDISGLGDVISNIDVKSVQDSGDGYTKVTLTTTKPVTIKTAAKHSAPLTPEQKAYKNLIAQSRTVKPVSNNVTSSTATLRFDNPAPVKAAAPAPKVEKQDVAVVPVPIPVAKEDKISDIVKKELKSENIENKSKMVDIKETKKSLGLQEIPRVDELSEVSVVQPIETANVTTENPKPKEDVSNVQKGSDKMINSVMPLVKNGIASNIPSNVLTVFVILSGAILGLVFFCKLIKKSLEGSSILKQSFKEHLLSRPVEVINYDSIAEDSELSWQEKYQEYVNTSKLNSTEGKVLKHIGNGEYQFVDEIFADAVSLNENDDMQFGVSEALSDLTSGSAALNPKKTNKFKTYNKSAKNSSPENIPPIKKVKNQDLKSSRVEYDYKDLEESLEKSLHNAPDMEELKIDEEVILNHLKDNFKTTPVVSETDNIAATMKKSKKLKSFENKIALEEAKRNIPSPKTRSEIRKTGVESKYVELGYSSLHTNPRKFEGANLSISDLIAKNDKFIDNNVKNQPNIQNDDNDVISIDEFFNKYERSSYVTASEALTDRVAEGLSKMSLDSNIKKVREQVQARNPFDGMVVLSGYNITDNSGFYVVRNKEGKSSLIGRINNDVTVLREFGRRYDIRLQVRTDSPNVYMVKADNFRYLVEVNDNKMGVLLEL